MRFGPTRLRLVLSREGHPALDAAVRDSVTQAARTLGYTLDVLDLESFVGSREAPGASAVVRQLLIGVQAGLPPDGLLLLGRQAQTARLQSMGLLQDVSRLMRTAKARSGALPEAIERAHFVEGTWLAAPLYQRLIGHWAAPDAFARAGLDPEAAAGTFPALGAAVSRLGGAWGIGPDDTPEADAWCWSAIHAWGGALVDLTGQRVTLASVETAASLEWLVSTFRGATWGAGGAPYRYTEGSAPPGMVLLTGPGGPANRPRPAAGGAAWLLPRGAAPDPAEKVWDALLQPEAQRRLWAAGAGFALPVFESQWADPVVAALPNQESVKRFRALLGGGFISDAGQPGRPSAASQAVEASRLAVRMVRAALAGRAVGEVLAAAQADAEAIYKEHAFPEG